MDLKGPNYGVDNIIDLFIAGDFINMESSDIKKLERGTTKLKFGIERLLAQDTCEKEDETMPSVSRVNNPISKPVPQIAVPCSDCVSSLFRCCR